jgi:hypothetical protein
VDPGEFLFCFEKDLTITLQRRQRDRFYVVHSAVLAAAGKAFMLVGPLGVGNRSLPGPCCITASATSATNWPRWTCTRSKCILILMPSA